jgi:hypothetical protein
MYFATFVQIKELRIPVSDLHYGCHEWRSDRSNTRVSVLDKLTRYSFMAMSYHLMIHSNIVRIARCSR